MKRYFLYALILGALGHSLLDSGTKVLTVSSTQVTLTKLGE